MGDVAYDLFHEINRLRRDPSSYRDELTNPIAKKELSKWTNYTINMQWNEGLARAARHVLND